MSSEDIEQKRDQFAAQLGQWEQIGFVYPGWSVRWDNEQQRLVAVFVASGTEYALFDEAFQGFMLGTNATIDWIESQRR